MNIHALKTDPGQFAAALRGDKDFEVRKNDRDFMVTDHIILEETEFPASEMVKGMPLKYTGRKLGRIIKHIQIGYGLPEGIVVLGLEKI